MKKYPSSYYVCDGLSYAAASRRSAVPLPADTVIRVLPVPVSAHIFQAANRIAYVILYLSAETFRQTTRFIESKEASSCVF